MDGTRISPANAKNKLNKNDKHSPKVVKSGQYNPK